MVIDPTTTALETVAAALVIYGLWLLTDSLGIVAVVVGVWLFAAAVAYGYHKQCEQQRIDYSKIDYSKPDDD